MDDRIRPWLPTEDGMRIDIIGAIVAFGLAIIAALWFAANSGQAAVDTASVIYTGLVALAFTCVRFFLQDRPAFDPLGPMGKAKFDFKDSWASILTLVGTAVAAVLSAWGTILPEKTEHLTKAQYTCLSLLFGFIILVGPLIYNATRRPDENAADRTPQGNILSFFIAAALTLWATQGQIVLYWFLLDELQRQGNLTGAAAGAFRILLIITFGFLAVYAWLSLGDTPRSQTEVKAARTSDKPLPEWSLL
jgi:hypothetical protein